MSGTKTTLILAVSFGLGYLAHTEEAKKMAIYGYNKVSDLFGSLKKKIDEKTSDIPAVEKEQEEE